MTPAEFDDQFNRLTAHFHLPADGSRETIALDWLKALEHYHVDALERGVSHLIRTETDRYWPALGAVMQAVRDKMAGMAPAHGKCLTCHGSKWIEVAPFKSNGMIYENVCQRCPDCGTPAPTVGEQRGRHSLTATEYQAWRNDEHARDYMPEGLKAKPWRDEAARLAHKRTMLAAFAALRIKLFGAA